MQFANVWKAHFFHRDFRRLIGVVARQSDTQSGDHMILLGRTAHHGLDANAKMQALDRLQ